MPVVLAPTAPSQPFAAPTITDALTRLRQDIFDQAGPAPRWQDSDLQRAIDRALDQYSFVSPWLQTALLPAIGGSRLYPAPSSGVTGPPWWVEAVEYPTARYPRFYVPFQELAQPSLGAPPAPTAVASSSFAVLNGLYRYRLTFLGIAGETLAGPSSLPLTVSNAGVIVTVPLGPAPYCLGRNLYRTPAGGPDGSQLLVATLDNIVTTYSDTVADAVLGVALPVADSTQNTPLLELKIPDSALPDPANPGSLAVTYAAKHAWAANGTTVPEQHHDIVLLGAAAYACLAYQVPTNDLFEYQDGELRDRVSEVKTPEHWLAIGKTLLANFKVRLEEVKQQRDAAYAATAQWGSVPSRWQWT